MRLACELEGIALCPESGACVGALADLVGRGVIEPHETTVIFNTGAAQKYVEVIETDLPRLDRDRPDWDLIERPIRA
jgi:threonine synthase